MLPKVVLANCQLAEDFCCSTKRALWSNKNEFLMDEDIEEDIEDTNGVGEWQNHRGSSRENKSLASTACVFIARETSVREGGTRQ